MRITQNMLTQSSLRNLTNSMKNIDHYNEQLTTGKKVSRPSDDPVIAMKGISYRSQFTQIEQFQRNLSEGYAWMEASDDALDKAANVFHRIRELVVNATNGTNSNEAREAFANEIEQLTDHVGTIGNTRLGGKYIFNGQNTTEAPVVIVGGLNTATISSANVSLEVSKGVDIPINIVANDLFSNANTFVPLQNLITDLRANSSNVGNYLSQIDDILTNFVGARTELGARYNRVEMIDDRLKSQEVIAKNVLSKNEDVDLEKVIIDLKAQEALHRAALGATSRIIQPSLLDFLR